MKKITTYLLSGLSFLLLSGCHPFVKYPYSPLLHKEAGAGAVSGALVGAEIGDATATAGAGMGIGALVGAGIGAYSVSEVHWLKRLQRDKVQVIQKGDRVWIIIPADEIFMFNSAAIIPSEYYILRDVTRFIKNYGHFHMITVSAYSDNVGDELEILKLTTARAKSVAGMLWSYGIPFDCLQAFGRGSSMPIATNNHTVGSAYNRRIEITFPVVYPRHGLH